MFWVCGMNGWMEEGMEEGMVSVVLMVVGWDEMVCDENGCVRCVWLREWG